MRSASGEQQRDTSGRLEGVVHRAAPATRGFRAEDVGGGQGHVWTCAATPPPILRGECPEAPMSPLGKRPQDTVCLTSTDLSGRVFSFKVTKWATGDA